MDIPSYSDFKKGYEAFQLHERRDAMYKIAAFLVEHFWGSPSQMADGLGVLLLTWNQAFYRYGPFDFDLLEECISDNLPLLEMFRDRNILSHSPKDDRNIGHLFRQFLTALQIRLGKKEGTKSPVAAAKALHLLGPRFFPLWDAKIAQVYGCRYAHNPAGKYLSFLRKMKRLVQQLEPAAKDEGSPKTILKLIDEYNYARFTKEWI